ncbi:MAG TPA: hypothetical protein VN948_15445 [Terriglobales bacterium]|nr:hypothetical protein [Terriglobales bacterium]
MTNYTKMTLLGAALAAFLLPATAQTSSAPATSNSPATSSAQTGLETGKQVQEHKENEQERIANGVGNGSLTAGEASSLEKKESQINQEERDMKAMDNGHLTKADRAALQQQQNQVSKQIYQDKHNGVVQNTHPTTEVGKRRENQQDRIAQGVSSGQLTAGETSHLEKQESNINREVYADRKANGGKLTAAERAQVNRQQNQVSKQIYKDKHNRRHQ